MANPWTPEKLVYGFKAAGDPRIAPDGARILYTLAQLNRELKKPSAQLWLCDRDGGHARQLTHSGDANGGGRWSHDGARIAFVSDRVKKAGIFVLDVNAGGEARELTRHNQGISDLAWSPDDSRIAYSTTFDPANPDEEEPQEGAAPKVRVTRRIDYKQDMRGYLGDVRNHLWVVDVASGERKRVSTELVDHGFPSWSPDGAWLASSMTMNNGMNAQLLLINVETGEQRRIGSERGTLSNWSWSPSGDRIIYAGDTQITFQSDFFVYDMASGETQRLTDDLQQLPDGGFPGMAPQPQLVWLDERQVLFHALRGGASGLYIIDADGGSVEPVKTWQAIHSGLNTDAQQRYFVQGLASMDALGEIVVFDAQTGEDTVITAYNTQTLAETPPAQWERFDVQRGKYTIEAWLLKPPSFDPNKKYPLVLDIHGGPNGFYGYAFNPVQQLLSTNDFIVVYSNPRGSSSYGREFTMQVSLDWGGEDYQDLMAVVDKASEQPYVDAERTGIYGYSYGGYMTSWIIGQTQRFKACVCGAPCFDLESMYGTSDISHQFGEVQWGGRPEEAREWYSAHSPATYAHRATTPTLIVQGEADERCPVGQAEQMFVALLKAGCEVEFARYPGGYHGFPRTGPADHREDFLSRVLGWFKEHLGEAG
jgi:dipeptidyl aminopeptidase/acylaminoacyl peptidase